MTQFILCVYSCPPDSRDKDPIFSLRHKSWSIYTNYFGPFLTASIWLNSNHVNCGQCDRSENLLGLLRNIFSFCRRGHQWHNSLSASVHWHICSRYIELLQLSCDYKETHQKDEADNEFRKVEKYSRDIYVFNYLNFISSRLLKIPFVKIHNSSVLFIYVLKDN